MALGLIYAILTASVPCEVIGTSALLASQQFTRPLPSALVLIFYGAALFGVSHTFRVIPMGIVHAIWSGLGIGWLGFGQRLDLPTTIGLGLIVAGVIVANAFSSTLTH